MLIKIIGLKRCDLFKRAFSHLIIILFCTGLVVGQDNQAVDSINQSSSLQDLLEFGTKNNPELMASYYKWKTVLERVSQVGILPDPQLTFAYFLRSVETRVGPQQGKIGIMQKFPWFGKLRLQSKAAVEAAGVEEQNFRNIKLSLYFEIKRNFYQYYFIIQKINLLKKNLKLLKYIKTVINNKYQSGTAAYTDFIKIQIEEKTMEDQIRSTKDQLIPAGSKLNAFLNRPNRAPLPILKKIDIINIPHKMEKLSELMVNNSPILKALDHQYKRTKIEVSLAKKNYYPDISLGFDYIVTGDSPMDSSLSIKNDPFIVMAKINLPVHFSKIKSSINQANFQSKFLVNQKQGKKNSLLNNLETVYFQFRDARNKALVYKNSLIPLAEQSVKIIQSDFETNKADILRLIDSQRTLLTLELVLEGALALHAEKSAELSMLVGENLEEE